MKMKAILIAACLLAPTAALAAPGIVTTSAGLRAGPGRDFPLVDRIPGGARVNVHGCLRGYAWCDVSWADDRGWVSSQYLEYLYHDSYVYLPDYVDEIDVPVVPFVLSSYWSSYYAGRPWYHRQAYWNDYWSSHQREATRLTLDPSAARIGRAATRNGAIAAGRDTGRAGTDRMTRGQNAAQIRGSREIQGREIQGREVRGREMQGRATTDQARGPRELQGREGRFAHGPTGALRENGAVRANPRAQSMAGARMQPQGFRAQQAPRVSAAPAARPAAPRVAQPNVGRPSPMSARAQMPAPRAAPAMPHPGGGAPRAAGGPPAGGGPGQKRH